MTVRFSNLTYNVVKAFMQSSHQGVMGLDEFIRLDQRITSGLGRRKIPYLTRSGGAFHLTTECMKAFHEFESADIYRHFESTAIAKCFAPFAKRRKVAVMKRQKAHAA